MGLVRKVGSVSGQAIAAAIVSGTMASRGMEVQLSELSTSPDPAVGRAFNDGWQITFLVLAGFTVVSFLAATLTRPGTKLADEVDDGADRKPIAAAAERGTAEAD